MNKIVIVLSGILLFCACNGKKSSTEAVAPSSAAVAEEEEAFRLIPPEKIAAGVQYTGERKADPETPLLVLDYKKEPVHKALDLKSYFDSVKLVLLEHPLPAGEGGFLYNCRVVLIGDRGMSSFHSDAQVWVDDTYILAGDRFFGLYGYDRNGKLIDTLAPGKGFKFKFKDSPLSIECKMADFHGYNGGLDLWNGRCSFIWSDTARRLSTRWYDVKKRKMVQEQPWDSRKGGPQPVALDRNTYFCVYNTLFSPEKVFLRTFSIQGDTLCEFTDYIRPEKEIRGSYAFPDRFDVYRLNGKQYVRQPFSDTVFQVSENRLLPVYVLDFGEKRMNISIATSNQSKAGKYVSASWKDTPEAILFAYTENYDCPRNRDNKEVKYYYSFYDKKAGQIFHMPVSGDIYPEELLISNSLEGGLPFTWDMAATSDGKLVIGYPRQRLEALTRLKGYKALPAAQKENVEKMLARMNDRQMLVMIIE